MSEGGRPGSDPEVVIVDDADSFEPREPRTLTEGGDRTSRPSVTDPVLLELQEVRAQLALLTSAVDRTHKLCVGHGHEFARMKEHMTAQALGGVVDLDEIQPNGLSGKRLLLVEPRRVLRERFESFLMRLGLRVLVARNQAEAMVDPAVDVALLNIRMPDSSAGVEFVKWFGRATPSARVIAFGSNLSEVHEIDRLPVVRLELPLQWEELRETLYDTIGHGAATADTQRPPPLHLVTDREEPTTRPEPLAARRPP